MTKTKLIEHQYLLTHDLKIINAYEGSGDNTLYFGTFLFSIETTEAAGESLRDMLQTAVDSTKKIIQE